MRRTLAIVLLLILVAVPVSAEIKLEIGPDTTVIDGPVNPDGTINYLAYMNQKLSEGVTPENNFAVDLMKAMPESHWPSPGYRIKAFVSAGIELHIDNRTLVSLPEYFTTIGDAQGPVDMESVYTVVTSRPWDEKEFLFVKSWLDSQEEVLDSLALGAAKSEFFFPMLAEDGGHEMLISSPFPWLRPMRGVGLALTARAQYKLGKGDMDGAWLDYVATRRSARLIMKQPLAISWIVGLSIDHYTSRILTQIASSEHLTPDLSKEMISALEQFEPTPRFADTHDYDARLFMLDAVQHAWKGRTDKLLELGRSFGLPYFDDRAIQLMTAEDYDPNFTLHAINQSIDELITASGIETYSDRQAAFARHESKLRLGAEQAEGILDPDREVSKEMQRQLQASNVSTVVATNLLLKPIDLVSYVGMDNVQTRYDMQLGLIPVVLAIGGYHAEHGRFPEDLNELVPAYLDELPNDFATGKLPVYRIEGDTAIVYSLGLNLEDDGGHDGFEDGDIKKGDIVFSITRP